MKKIIWIFILFALLIFSPKRVFAEEQGYTIKKFSSKIEVQADTSLLITETILANFKVQKHGIIRVIPYIYSHGGQTINGRMEILSVTNENGQSYSYSESILNQSRKLQIGDANVYVTGDKTYVISYRMRNIVLRYDNIPEVYWNVTGHEWDTVIENAEAVVVSKNAEINKIKCFEGPVGSTKECSGTFASDNAIFKTTKAILPGNDFTIVVGLSENNSLVFPAPITKMLDNWGYGISLIPLLVMAFLWFKLGRDKKYVGDNIYYKPDKPVEKNASIFERKFLPLVYSPIKNLTPSEMGAIIDEKIDIGDIVAEIVELARLGYIKIEKVKDKKLFSEAEYSFTKEKEWSNSGILKFQQAILGKIFKSSSKSTKPKVLLSSLKSDFYEALPDIKKKLFEELKNKDVFSVNPETVRKVWLLGYIVVSFTAGFFTLSFSMSTFNFGPVISGTIAFFLGIPFSLSMPRKTAWGYSLSRQAIGLREYLKIGKWREEYKEKKLFIDEMLPLAIALGVVGKLVSDMKDLELEPPSYFANTTSALFYSDLMNFQRVASSSLVTAPAGKSFSGSSSWSGGSGFSGGGSSGGGFGGGGGGSW